MSNERAPLILSLETATRAGGICVLRGETSVAFRSGDPRISHSTHLLDYIKSVLDEAAVTLRDIEVLTVAAGPGSFTGLRIGLATAKSFAATLKRPCFGVPTLYAVASGAGQSRRTIAMLPAGRGEVYAQQLMVSGHGEVQPLEAPTHIAPHDLLERVSSFRNLKWAGEGAQLHAGTIKRYAVSKGLEFQTIDSQTRTNNDGERWSLVSEAEALALSVAKLALFRIRQGETSFPQDLQAIYVRPSDAELNERCQ